MANCSSINPHLFLTCVLRMLALELPCFAMEAPEKSPTKTQSLIAKALGDHVSADDQAAKTVTTIIQDYCSGPYFFAQYISDEHEKAGEDITMACISPLECAIGTGGCNRARDTHSIRIHCTDKGISLYNEDFGDQQLYDIG